MSGAYVVCKQESNCVDTVHTQHSAGTGVHRQFGYYNGDSLVVPSFKENVRLPLAGTANQVPCLSSRQVRQHFLPEEVRMTTMKPQSDS